MFESNVYEGKSGILLYGELEPDSIFDGNFQANWNGFIELFETKEEMMISVGTMISDFNLLKVSENELLKRRASYDKIIQRMVLK